jgi:Xaa-Pro aminopeptidase
MFSAQTYVDRRKGLREQLDTGLILLLGNNDVGMNYIGNTFRYRQDSNFLYYVGIDHTGMATIIDLDEGTETLFGNDFSIDDIVWMGPQPTTAELGAKAGLSETKPLSELEAAVKKSKKCWS